MVQIGKDITDYAIGEEDENAGDEKMDDELGVAVVFDEDEEEEVCVPPPPGAVLFHRAPYASGGRFAHAGGCRG